MKGSIAGVCLSLLFLLVFSMPVLAGEPEEWAAIAAMLEDYDAPEDDLKPALAQYLNRWPEGEHIYEVVLWNIKFNMDYSKGRAADFLPVLDALKELQRIERIIVRQERALLGFRIQLHRALGGRVTATSIGGSI